MNNIGILVEKLIAIKDRHKPELSFDEIDTLNDACNIIYHNFDSHESCYDVIEKGREGRSNKKAN